MWVHKERPSLVPSSPAAAAAPAPLSALLLAPAKITISSSLSLSFSYANLSALGFPILFTISSRFVSSRDKKG
ncbi:hypothetical protein MRB53_007056 [Persea americana]|uniref:Uncharacterized protein n=1 Tax=Persea americana TaxID=3435 RepID=A0ACC2MI56_PERAE|nr:hypothetical protein MRB53_007056 [Persea americana]